MMERMSSPPPLSHVSADGRAVMVDVSEKPVTERVAVAEGFVRISAELEARIRAGAAPKERQAMPPLRSSKPQSTRPAASISRCRASGRGQASTVSGR